MTHCTTEKGDKIRKKCEKFPGLPNYAFPRWPHSIAHACFSNIGQRDLDPETCFHILEFAKIWQKVVARDKRRFHFVMATFSLPFTLIQDTSAGSKPPRQLEVDRAS